MFRCDQKYPVLDAMAAFIYVTKYTLQMIHIFKCSHYLLPLSNTQFGDAHVDCLKNVLCLTKTPLHFAGCSPLIKAHRIHRNIFS